MDEDKAISPGALLLAIIKRQVKPEAFKWLEDKGKLVNSETAMGSLNSAFAAAPRKTGRLEVEVTTEELKQLSQICAGFTIKNWTTDKLSRLWLLLQVNAKDESVYHTRLESLFRDAEMNEIAALYASLPLFAYPQSWQFQTTEGIRSNIGTVLESIMYENPYPAKYLAEPSWNQLVLKAFFTEKDMTRIIGLDERANKALADILLDYAHERQAAHRMVNPQLWRLITKFIDEHSIVDIEKLFDDVHISVRRAAVLTCYYSDYEPAKQLMQKEPAIVKSIKSNLLTWNAL